MSVVIAAARDASVAIGDCLDALVRQSHGRAVEIIVAGGASDGIAARIRQRFPSVHVLHHDDVLSVPQLRGIGIARARGDLVALLDPYCIPGDKWLDALLAVHGARTEPAVGGAVELEHADEQGVVRWATYLAEYAQFMRPFPEGRAVELPGSNIAYKRGALGDVTEAGRSGFWKTSVNHELLAGNAGLWLTPTMVVRLRKPIPFGQFLRSRYHHGRSFAARRAGGSGRTHRYLRAGTAWVIPWLFLWRQGRAVLAKRRGRRRFLAASPLLVLFHCSWALGEMIGYLRGTGRSEAELLY